MNNMIIYNLMKNLITKKFYATKEEATEKLGVYYAFNMITDEQMAELVLLAEGVYALPEPVIPEPDPTPEVPVEPDPGTSTEPDPAPEVPADPETPADNPEV